MKFLVAFKRGDKNLLKIDFGGDEGEKWCETSAKVVNYAKAQIKEGDEVDLDYVLDDGKYKVNKIMKKGSKTSTSTSSQNVCSDCGKELKSDKYDKCYNCNKKNKNSNTTKSSNFDADLSRKQTIAHAVSRSLIALQGHIEPNNIGEIIDTLYQKYNELI